MGLERLYGEHTQEVAVQLARHFQAAGIAQKALGYLRQAGERAVRLSANEEAIAHFSQALVLLDTLPAGTERDQLELGLQTRLGAALVATQGFAAPEVKKTYDRARELCREAAETPQLFPALWGMWLVYFTQGDHRSALELGEQLLNLAQGVQDSKLLLQAHHALWSTLPYLGDLDSARAHCEQGIALYDAQQHHALTFRYGGHNPGVCCLNFRGPVLWYLGYPDQALQRNTEALAMAQELSHPLTLALTLYWLALVYQLRRESARTIGIAEAGISLATEHRFALISGWTTSLRGWALAQQGQIEEGIAQIRQGVADYRATGAGMDQTHLLALLAEAHGLAGQTEAGLGVLSEALTAADTTGERHYLAELYRLRGELFSAHDETLAEVSFRQAIDVAQTQDAKSWELRAVTSLSRLWHQQGKTEAARERLAEVLDWFTEGFDTLDLMEARELRKALA
jgi:predicted ATPase